MNRRQFGKNLLGTVVSYSLMEMLFESNAFGASVKPILKHWSIRLNEFCSDLRKETISPAEWQEHIDILYNTVEMAELLKFIDFENLQRGFQYADLGVNTNTVKFPNLDGLPENTLFVKKIFVAVLLIPP